MIGPDPTDEKQVLVVGNAIANARGGRRGMPMVVNAVEMLRTMGFRELADDVLDDARAVLTALRDQA